MIERKIGTNGPLATPLGFGSMRMPSKEMDGEKVLLEQEAVELIRYAIDQGITYIDTAYPYHNKMSEVAVGKALKDGYRERVVLATKSPVWLIEKTEEFSTYLDEQLEKLQTEYVDMYLFHALNRERWEKIQDLELLKEALKEKERGRIRNIGFSFHDEYDVFMEILDGFDWDFCQLQMNYVDEAYQQTIEGFYEAKRRGLGVIVMEPLRGGKLVNPPKSVQETIPEGMSPVEWALHYLFSTEGVDVVLSGMGTKEEVDQNIKIAMMDHHFKESEAELYRKGREAFTTMGLVACTACEYCLPCPMNINIPKVFESYNLSFSRSKELAKEHYERLEKNASNCVACRSCEKVCPQHIVVSEEMKRIHPFFQEAE
ncbi:aldo/keto reductase [Guggenheimella bovis]